MFTTLAASASVTSLQLDLVRPGLPPPAVCTSVGALCSLRELRLNHDRLTRSQPILAMPDGLATALQQQLPHLTLLETGFGLTSEQLQQLPHSLQQLEFRLAPAQGGAEDAAADLAHLTALTSLSLPPATAQWVLPGSLLTLRASGPCHATCSTHLQSLELFEPHLCPELIKQLPRLPQLRWLVAQVGYSLPEPEVAQQLSGAPLR